MDSNGLLKPQIENSRLKHLIGLVDKITSLNVDHQRN